MTPSLPKDGYDKTSSFVFAVDFALPGGGWVLAPYAYLSRAKMPHSGELSFYYSFGEFRVKGKNLDPIYEAAHQHVLTAVRCNPGEDDPEATRVEEIVYEETDWDEP